uniref:Uncharacterized protein n=1 Tax=viral metagenome TaxID=1070528 RepID=A0A6C0LHY2_9ZZZZ
MEGTVIINMKITKTIRCSMAILLLVNRIARQMIKIVIKRAIPAYFDCSDPKNTSLKFVAIFYIYILI